MSWNGNNKCHDDWLNLIARSNQSLIRFKADEININKDNNYLKPTQWACSPFSPLSLSVWARARACVCISWCICCLRPRGVLSFAMISPGPCRYLLSAAQVHVHAISIACSSCVFTFSYSLLSTSISFAPAPSHSGTIFLYSSYSSLTRSQCRLWWGIFPDMPPKILLLITVPRRIWHRC